MQYVNYSGKYSFFQNLYRLINVRHRNAQDLKTTQACLSQLQTLTQQAQLIDCSSGINRELSEVLQGASILHKRVSKSYFASKALKSEAAKIQRYLTAKKIATHQNIPFRAIIDNPEVQKMIEANHFHHKITQQHQAMGLRLSYNNGDIMIPVRHKNAPVPISKLPELYAKKYNKKTGKIADTEFLADGLELHHFKQWSRLRPLYKLQVEQGNYVHIDTLTGKKEVVGVAGKNYIQLVNVMPWGKNAFNGSLLGHTWLRIVYKGELFHVGLGLSGYILNPDFMASVSLKGKRFGASKWKLIDDQNVDQHKRTLSNRLMIQLNLVQQYIKHGHLPKKTLYAKEVMKLYDEIEYKFGGTCNSGATKIFQMVTGEDYYKRSRTIISRIFFNKFSNKALDAFYSVLPKKIRRYTIGLVQTVTRGGLPFILGTRLS